MIKTLKNLAVAAGLLACAEQASFAAMDAYSTNLMTTGLCTFAGDGTVLAKTNTSAFQPIIAVHRNAGMTISMLYSGDATASNGVIALRLGVSQVPGNIGTNSYYFSTVSTNLTLGPIAQPTAGGAAALARATWFLPPAMLNNVKWVKVLQAECNATNNLYITNVVASQYWTP